MKRQFLLLSFSLFSIIAFSNKDSLNSSISNVKLYNQSALIERAISTTLTKGRHQLKIYKIEKGLIESTFRLETSSNIQLISVSHSVEVESVLPKLAFIKKYNDSIEVMKQEIEEFGIKKNYLNYEMELLKKNQLVAGTVNGMAVNDLVGIVDFHRKRSEAIFKELYEIEQKTSLVNGRINILKFSIENIKKTPLKEKPYIKLDVIVGKTRLEEIRFNFLCQNAGWYASYDVKLLSINSPLSMLMKANVWQNTGVDWDNITLTLVNGSPNVNRTYQSLVKNALRLEQNNGKYSEYFIGDLGKISSMIGKTIKGQVRDNSGEPLPGANIILIGTSIGTITDIDGSFNLNIPENSSDMMISYTGFESLQLNINKLNFDIVLKQGHILDEVIITQTGVSNTEPIKIKDEILENKKGDGITFSQQPTTFSYQLNTPSIIPSGNSQFLINIKEFDVNANYEYHTSPKLEKTAYLVAQAYGYDSLSLIEGEANIYFENIFLGKTLFNPKVLFESTLIVLDKDESIIVERSETRSFKKVSQSRSVNEVKKEFEVGIKNTKNSDITIIIYDQFPISENKEIKVDDKKCQECILDEKTGIFYWKLSLKPNETIKKIISYTVKYPYQSIMTGDLD